MTQATKQSRLWGKGIVFLCFFLSHMYATSESVKISGRDFACPILIVANLRKERKTEKTLVLSNNDERAEKGKKSFYIFRHQRKKRGATEKKHLQNANAFDGIKSKKSEQLALGFASFGGDKGNEND